MDETMALLAALVLGAAGPAPAEEAKQKDSRPNAASNAEADHKRGHQNGAASNVKEDHKRRHPNETGSDAKRDKRGARKPGPHAGTPGHK